MNPTPKWFRPVAIVVLVWNLLGCAAYLSDVTITPERLSAMTAAQQAMYHARPAWSVAGTAVAVWFGAAGSLGLVLRKKWSVALLALSLAGVVVQDAWLFGMSGAAGAAPAVIQGLVLVIGIALLLLSRRAAERGWLS